MSKSPVIVAIHGCVIGFDTVQFCDNCGHIMMEERQHQKCVNCGHIVPCCEGAPQ